MSRLGKGTGAGMIVAAVACAVVGLAGQPAAFAGETPPPHTSGFVRYSGPAADTSCTAGKPTALTFHFSYDASHLHLAHTVSLRVSASNASQSAYASKAVFLTIRPGTHKSVSHRFRLPAKVRSGWTFYARAGSKSYNYVARGAKLSCAHPHAYRLIAPKVSAGPVSCSHSAYIHFDSTRSNQTWYYMIFPASGGFEPGLRPSQLTPGTHQRHRETQVKAGGSFELHVDSPLGLIDLGKFHFTNGCHR